MSNQTSVLTHEGVLYIETGIPLVDLQPGDQVLGLPDVFDPNAPRTVYSVIGTLGQYHVPAEDPTVVERLLAKLGAERVFAGAKVEGVLVQGRHNSALFALEDTPALDRVLF